MKKLGKSPPKRLDKPCPDVVSLCCKLTINLENTAKPKRGCTRDP